MRILIVGLMLTLAAMAGCLGGDDDPEPTPTPTATSTPTATEAPTATPTPTTTPGPEPGDVGAELAANATEGEAPLQITFSINASGFDEEFLEWSLDADGDGEADFTGQTVPATAEFTYDAVGNYTATVTVTDGLETATASAEIRVVAAEAEEEEPANGVEFPLVYELSTTLPCPDCYFVFEGVTGACAEWTVLALPLPMHPGGGVRCEWTEVPPEAAGRAFTLTGGADPDIEFFDTCGGATATSLEWFSNEGGEAGTVPEGAGCAVVYDFVAEMAEMVLTIS